jgi:membrane protein implicated in regulation of membrane protease activity
MKQALGSPMRKPFEKIASVVFGVVAAVHVRRLVFPFSLVVGGFAVPLWFNAIGFLIAAVLTALLWRESQQKAEFPQNKPRRKP